MNKEAKTPEELKLEGDNAAEWKSFMQKMNLYMVASKINEEIEEYKRVVLLNYVGDKKLKICNIFEFTKSEAKNTYTYFVNDPRNL